MERQTGRLIDDRPRGQTSIVHGANTSGRGPHATGECPSAIAGSADTGVTGCGSLERPFTALRDRRGLRGSTVGTYVGSESDCVIGPSEALLQCLRRCVDVAEVVREFRGRQDDRSVAKTIELHRMVVERFLEDPERVLEFGRRRLEVLEASWSGRTASYVEAWRDLLDGPRIDLVGVLLSLDEVDVELLKMSPFTTLIGDDEMVEVVRRARLRRARAVR